MITYVDTSTLLKLIIDEDGSGQAAVIWDHADDLVAVRLLYVEARAALAAAHRGKRLSAVQYAEAVGDLDLLWEQVSVVEVTSGLVDRAVKLAEQHGLRGYDAVHLSAAVEVDADIFTSADSKLCDAASAAGFHVANPVVTGPVVTGPTT